MRKLPPGSLPKKLLVDAIGAAVPHLERSAIASYRDASARQQNCVSCHNQYLPLLALAAVRQKGLPRDEDAAATIRGFIQSGSETLSPFSTEATFHPAPGHSVGYEFLALAAEGRPPTPGTDEQAHLLSASQLADGRWMNHFPRPPINTSDVGATALAIAALRTYPLPGRAAEIQDRIARARRWLESVKPRNHAEQVFQLLGLSWGGAEGAIVSRLGKALVATQREDGGWSQLPALPNVPLLPFHAQGLAKN